MNSVRILLLAMLFACASVPALALDADSLSVSVGLRLGTGQLRGYLADVNDNSCTVRSGVTGIELTVHRACNFQIGIGLERHIAQSERFTTDTVIAYFGQDSRLSAWFIYLSPGVHSRIGEDQPLDIGGVVDIGVLWVSDRVRGRLDEFSHGERILAIRPKVVISYDVYQNTVLHLECGWMYAEMESAYYHDRFEFYPWTQYRRFWRSLTGSYYGVMLSISPPWTGGN